MFKVFRAVSTVSRGILIFVYSGLNLFAPNNSVSQMIKRDCIDYWDELKEKDIETDKQKVQEVQGALTIFLFTLRNLFRG